MPELLCLGSVYIYAEPNVSGAPCAKLEHITPRDLQGGGRPVFPILSRILPSLLEQSQAEPEHPCGRFLSFTLHNLGYIVVQATHGETQSPLTFILSSLISWEIARPLGGRPLPPATGQIHQGAPNPPDVTSVGCKA